MAALISLLLLCLLVGSASTLVGPSMVLQEGSLRVMPLELTASENDYFFEGFYQVKADLYAKGNDKGFDSPDVFQTYVHNPAFQVYAQIQLHIEGEIMRFIKIRHITNLNLLNFGIGLWWYTPTFHTPEMCFLFYYNYEVLALHSSLDRNVKTCSRPSDKFITPAPVPFWSSFDCRYERANIERDIDLGRWQHVYLMPEKTLQEFPIATCLF